MATAEITGKKEWGQSWMWRHAFVLLHNIC